MNSVISRNDDGRYCLSEPVTSDIIVNLARNIISEAFERPDKLNSPTDTRNFLIMQLALEQSEVFGVVFLDRQHQVIAFERMFFGTIDSATVHPREVVKRCLELNAAVVILTHNHPSGVPEPSPADIAITKRLVSALGLVDIKILDHIVVGGAETVSFAERGLI
tara:strand:- start:420 stop:911 length:492 start_codon:yes stop_codon:yes gene_type:complete